MNVQRYIMPQRPDWNAIGPHLPLWFRRQLKKLDKRFVLQFIPPYPVLGSKLSRELFPRGCWVICRKLSRTGWLHNRWVMSLSDENGNPASPTPDSIAMLRVAKNLWRRSQADRLDQELDRSMRAVEAAKTEESRERMLSDLDRVLSKRNFMQHASSRVTVPVMAMAG
jgi:hypothetical protein